MDAVMAMTGAKSGAALVATPVGELVGIFTDGDLRRLLAEGHDIANSSIESVMTRDPVAVNQSAYAVDVLRVFERYKIDDLPVVDDQQHLVGCVDIQDLPKMKVM